jgi:hypothetical protein
VKSKLFGIAFSLTILSPVVARADLIGSQVIGALLFPNQTTFCNIPGICSSPIGPVLVTSGVEFPTNSLVSTGSLDITGSQIIWTATMPVTYAPGEFNGFNVSFTGAPTITNVTVDAASTMLPVAFSGPPISSASGFSFDADGILFNVADLTVVAGQKLILNVQTSESAVPEPATGVLMGTALLLFGGVISLRRKRRVVPAPQLLSGRLADTAP